ncbi:Os10g0437200 [Oryza sativa Japonica Group]|uniref:Os10g0437200 protein n=1 Tax=Oryza sativa subsp. japonica TaxID=39947 RepID=C7J822_ORYSJ|nr:Os10g0437200 [Oryza sativa Japonica Group]|eukprot:NP_001176173.1 Os10g0437200 [Oryza sativa Japonica Group]
MYLIMPSLFRYAREDTHYLLYIYDLMRLRLVKESSDENDLLLEVYKRSKEICLQLYEKELLTHSSYLYIHGFVFCLWCCFFVINNVHAT